MLRSASTRVRIIRTLFPIAGLVTIATGVTTARTQPRGPAAQAPALTERAEIAQEGVVLRFPAGWSLEQDRTAIRVIAMPPEATPSLA